MFDLSLETTVVPAEAGATKVESLHKKQQMMIILSNGLICIECSRLLNHWAQVELSGHFFKGHQQPSQNCLGGGLTTTLPTCFQKQEKIYDECMHSFNELPQEESSTTIAYDNHSKIMP